MGCFEVTPTSRNITNLRIPNAPDGMKRIMELEWWSRMWTVQEVVLPPKATIIYGTLTAPWSIFTNAWSTYSDHSNTCCSISFLAMDPAETEILSMTNDKIAEIEAVKSELAQGETESHGLFYRFSGQKASDARVKVFGILAMIDPDSEHVSLSPNYSLSKRKVYTTATIEIIKSTESLYPIENVHPSPDRDIPSWVLDWEYPPPRNIKSGEIYRTYMRRHYGLL
ncbi:hypothetical protein EJ08DRAFT_102415 [Tothia fuscella]|uniref:Heterokaryon incompatibility domain-containing protein n=1 Tax=Tothia fuscella TaxID=1048955 RepID=A0A9P4NX68_9PEZI|nr:hypothetical protein EJ08DRAFT_102415 [Tothia fuscella]